MPFTLTMPKLSPTMEEGTIAKWRKKEGDFVKVGEVIFEIATDKATVEHAVIDAGYLRKIIIKEGESAVVNQPVGIFTEKKEESIEGYKPEGAAPKAAAAPAVKKAEAPAPVAAASNAGLSQPAFTPEPALKNYEFPPSTTPSYIPASPLAKKLAKEKGIDLSTVKGSGPGHRVVSSDLDLGQPDLSVTFGRHERPKVAPGTYEQEKMSPIRKVIAERLQAAKTFIPHFYVTMEIRAEKLLDAREQLKSMGHKISINDFVVRACALALREHPEVNSGFNSADQTLIRFKTVDISVAVALNDGLITPIVRYADYKNLGEISAEIKVLAQKAKEGKLQREEYVGGSFTVSNLGMYGVSDFVGIINPPQAALVAIGAIEDRAVVEDHAIMPGKVMRLTLSGDHRVIDGAIGAQFLQTVKKFLENPTSLLMT
ncbi:MAG TPA: pyruvate dehydrogenase complex dihydrolipoamide acetyltransferase [Rhabdochlamydiaceae bacterium]|jgi:pyruvate dehydrogenase E2 component (dihydrolipoamide acetyltransferase)|nr:pyruvate dehydrogenase complex dihydrolipoamide acetyltransferase [Rhabdochlamydiaceae bacterium]